MKVLGKVREKMVPYSTDAGFMRYTEDPAHGRRSAVHILNENGDIIPNVFAAGETATAQLFGDYYVSGFSLGLYTTVGRIAGEVDAAEVSE